MKKSSIESFDRIKNYVHSLKVLVTTDADLITSCFEIVSALAESVAEFMVSGTAPQRWIEERSNRPLIKYLHNLMVNRESFSKEIDVETLKLYIVMNESDLFDLVIGRQSNFISAVKRNQKWILSFVAAFLIVGFLIKQIMKDPRQDVWRVTYFDSAKLNGKKFSPYYYKELYFDWQFESPISAQNLEEFSLIAVSCLRVEEGEQEYMFQLSSDDGSRLYIDRKLQGGNWVSQKETLSEIPVRLTPGNHIVEIHYFDSGGLASLKLNLVTNRRNLAVSDEKFFYLPKVMKSSSIQCDE